MEDSPSHMWPYWRDKYGLVEALQAQYPNRLANDPELTEAIREIMRAMKRIDHIMIGWPEDTYE